MAKVDVLTACPAVLDSDDLVGRDEIEHITQRAPVGRQIGVASEYFRRQPSREEEEVAQGQSEAAVMDTARVDSRTQDETLLRLTKESSPAADWWRRPKIQAITPDYGNTVL